MSEAVIPDRRKAVDATAFDEIPQEYVESCFNAHPQDDSVVCYMPKDHYAYCSATVEGHGRVWWDGGQPKAPAPE